MTRDLSWLTPELVAKEITAQGLNIKAAARALNVGYKQVHNRYVKAVNQGLLDPLPRGAKSFRPSGHSGIKDDGSACATYGDKRVNRLPATGRVKARKTHKAEMPKRGIKRYLFTSAQNETGLFLKFWDNLMVLKDHYKAELHVARFTYMKSGMGASGDKSRLTGRGGNGAGKELVWDSRLVPYFSDDRIQIAPGLVWCGEVNILPTADDPLSGFEAYTGRASGIFPHPQIAMRPVASGRTEGTKFNYTTGAVTLLNYVQRKAGLKAEFHHAFGALLVEVDSEGSWWCRQLNADDSGTFYDLDLRVKDGEITTGHRIKGITWGDIHHEERDERVYACHWGKNGKGGMIDDLQPEYQFLHDVNSFKARSHHRIKDPHERFKNWVNGTESIEVELVGIGEWMKTIERETCKTVVVDSNHHNHIGRWLKEDHRFDAPNVEFWYGMNKKISDLITAGQPYSYLQESLRYFGYPCDGVRFLMQDESFILCPDAGGGIECGDHGDLGPNGSRGNPKVFTRMGRKRNIGHFHGPGIYKGVYVSGTSGTLTPDWTAGPSTWSNSDVITYPNGKRAILTLWAKDKESPMKYRA